MALDTELRATTYAGNASTVIPYPILFPYLEAADIKVQVTALGAASATLLSESAYTVHEPVDGGAYVTTTAAYPATTTVEVFRFMDYLQPLVMPEGGKLSSVTLEQALDRVTMLAMQGGDGGYSIPSAGSRDSAIFADAGTRAVTAASRVGQLGVQLDNGSVWRALSTYAGDWQEIMPAIRSDERNVHTQAQLQAAFADSGARIIYVRKDIELDDVLTMNADKTLVMDNYRFSQSGDGGGLILLGVVVADRKQIFSGFAAGEITGTFGGVVYPEWWGLVDGYHDVAINLAIRAGRLATSNLGIKVSLAPRQYDVSAPIDMASQSCFLEGHGSALTILKSTANWDTTQWLKAEQWGPVDDVLNHAAMVWIGGEPLPSARFGSTYRNQVRGIGINCYSASLAHAGVNAVTRIGTGAKRVSGISSKAGVEECSIIDDVVVSYASGFGIGFCRHRQVGQAFSAATVNGLTISNCWIMGPTFRDSVPIYFSPWTNNCKLSVTTVDIGVAKSVSADYGVVVAGDLSGNGATVYSLPEWIVTYPLAAIVAQGFVSIEDIHIEGAIIGVHVLENSSINNVSVRNVKAFAMMDSARSAVYELDGKSGAIPPTNTLNYRYGCAVMISGQGEAATYGRFNWRDRASLNNISILGGCAYIVRDSMYEVERTSYGMGDAYTRTAGTGGIVSYVRGNAYVDSAAPGSTVWSSATALQKAERTYFIGPIH